MERAGDPFFFGYGSLVNRATHDYPRAARAKVRGWARVWRGTSLRQVAYLSATEAPGVEIEGLIAAVPGGDWRALDRREAAYARHPLAMVEHDLPGRLSVMIYKVEAHHVSTAGPHPILLSYLDVVVQGYLREFGPGGVARFFETTRGWEVGVLDDRAAPQYPRAQVTTAPDRAMVDAGLRDLGM
ncbi:gamma-glutamylcyclotransferase family protein [Roseicyclus mahoneyensis]|nr:gamma-glutamylcyclotransferase family protein [Roseicyclus mahoneyensis]